MSGEVSTAIKARVLELGIPVQDPDRFASEVDGLLSRMHQEVRDLSARHGIHLTVEHNFKIDRALKNHRKRR